MTAEPIFCGHCGDRIDLYGGVWFVRRAGAVCYRSPDTQHRPYGAEVPVTSGKRAHLSPGRMAGVR